MTPEAWPKRFCRTCEQWKEHEVFEVQGRGKDRGRTLVKADCFTCRDAWRTKLLERVKAARARGVPDPGVAKVAEKREAAQREAEKAQALGPRYTYFGKLPALLHLVMQTGFYLGRATALRNKMRRKVAWVSYYKYRERMIAALEAARKRVASAETTQEGTTSPQEKQEWERMQREVEELARRLGGSGGL